MTPLGEKLIRRIAATGPITVADFMADCLLDPQHGYYATRDPFGTEGDFTTAPEISQMFGELLGLALAEAWSDQGRPDPFVLAELGPGRGTLMADLLRATRIVPGFHEAAELWLVESSPALRGRQAEALAGPRVLRWADTADELPDAPLFLVANEFFDALPVRQFQRTGDVWRERQVGVGDGRLVMGLGGPAAPPELAGRLADTPDGGIVETRPAAAAVMQAIESRIAAHGGAALIVDYGDWRSRGDTLQAVKGHARADPLQRPGEADLTAHVDFEALANAAPGLAHTGLTTQGVFLERLGITGRAQALAKGLSLADLEAHVAAHRRLTHPEEMGSLFKAIGFYPKEAAAPPGLDP